MPGQRNLEVRYAKWNGKDKYCVITYMRNLLFLKANVINMKNRMVVEGVGGGGWEGVG